MAQEVTTPEATPTPAATANTATTQAAAGADGIGETPPAASKPPQLLYKVASGDTLASIAKRAGLADFAALYELNKDLIGPDPSKLAVGQELKLPDGAKDPGAPVAATSIPGIVTAPGNGRGNNGNGVGNGGSNRTGTSTGSSTSTGTGTGTGSGTGTSTQTGPTGAPDPAPVDDPAPAVTAQERAKPLTDPSTVLSARARAQPLTDPSTVLGNEAREVSERRTALLGYRPSTLAR